MHGTGGWGIGGQINSTLVFLDRHVVKSSRLQNPEFHASTVKMLRFGIALKSRKRSCS
jgi:hypothetical protein